MKYMYRKIVSLFAVAFLLLGVTGCKKNVNIEQLEKDLVGVWCDEFEYSGTTEAGTPFSKVLLAIQADADHTGCIYLALFDDEHSEHLDVYGGPKDAGFRWRLLGDGSVELSDPASGESTVLTRSDSGNDSNYGDNMTNVSATNVTYGNGTMTVSNGSYSGTLQKANAGRRAAIRKTAAALQHKELQEATSEDLGKVIGADGRIYETSADATDSGTTAVAVIAYKNNDVFTDYIYMAISINDEFNGDRVTWYTANDSIGGKAAIKGGMWAFPTRNQGKTLLVANGGDEKTWAGLNAVITKAGGTALRDELYGYWTSSADSKLGDRWVSEMKLFGDEVFFQEMPNDYKDYVRYFFVFFALPN